MEHAKPTPHSQSQPEIQRDRHRIKPSAPDHADASVTAVPSQEVPTLEIPNQDVPPKTSPHETHPANSSNQMEKFDLIDFLCGFGIHVENSLKKPRSR